MPDKSAGGFELHDSKFRGNYRGTVMDNNDPDQYGKVRVMIFPMLSGLETTDLPWAIPAMPLWDGAGDGTGSFVVPKIGSNVYCFFEEGDIYQPVYFAEAQDALRGLPTERVIDYPNTKVRKSSGGMIEVVNDTPGDKATTVVRDETKTIGRNQITVISGDETRAVDGDRDIEVDGSDTTTVGETSTLTTVLDFITTIGRNFTMTVVNMASIIDLTGQRLSQTGDVKSSFATSLSGWLLLVPNTVGKEGSGATYIGSQYEALFNVLRSASPNTGSENFDSLDIVTLPDFRGRKPLGLDNMGGSQAGVLTAANTPNRNVLGGEIGEEKHLLLHEESGVPAHDHIEKVMSAGGGVVGVQQVVAANPVNSAISTADNTPEDAAQSHNNIEPGIMTNWFVKI